MTVLNAIEVLRKLNPCAVITGWDEAEGRFTVATSTTHTYKKPVNDERVVSVLDAVAHEFQTTTNAIMSRDRHENVAMARHMAVFMMRVLGMSYPKIASLIGGRNHKCSMDSVKRAKEMFATNKRWMDAALRVKEHAKIAVDIRSVWAEVP